jgi:WD40 repeat protein
MTAKIWDAGSGVCLQTLEGHSSRVSSAALSSDGRWVVTASYDGTARIWDASSGAGKQTREVGRSLMNPAFDVGDRALITEIGCLHFDVLSIPEQAANASIITQDSRDVIGLSEDGRWITLNAQNHVWLPSEYRPSCSAVYRNILAVGVGSGRVWICIIDD